MSNLFSSIFRKLTNIFILFKINNYNKLARPSFIFNWYKCMFTCIKSASFVKFVCFISTFWIIIILQLKKLLNIVFLKFRAMAPILKELKVNFKLLYLLFHKQELLQLQNLFECTDNLSNFNNSIYFCARNWNVKKLW